MVIVAVCKVLLKKGHEGFDIVRKHLRREAQLADRNPHHTRTLPVLIRANEFLNRLLDMTRDRLGLVIWHHALGTKDAPKIGLLQGRLAVHMANQLVERDISLPNPLEQCLLANGHSTGRQRFGRQGAILGADDTNTGVALDCVREADTVAQDGTALSCPQLDVQFILGHMWRVADLEGTQIPGERQC